MGEHSETINPSFDSARIYVKDVEIHTRTDMYLYLFQGIFCNSIGVQFIYFCKWFFFFN